MFLRSWHRWYAQERHLGNYTRIFVGVCCYILNPRPAGPSPDPTLCWGGGGPYRPPHLSRKPTDVGEKFKRQWKGLDEIFQIKFKNLTSRSPVTSQVRSNTKCLTFPFNAFPRQNAGNKRISSRWIDMIRVCDISEHRLYSEVTFSEVKVIWGHEVKLSISVIWRRNTCLWVGFSSRTRKMTLEHRLLHRNRNKMKIWKCMVLRPNALKSSHFSHSKCYKNRIYEGNYLKLGTYIL